VKILLATITTPFIDGGAEYLIHGLHRALSQVGHAVARISIPFRFGPLEQVWRSIQLWESEDLTLLNGQEADRVICFQFPAYYLNHPSKALWLLHQYRVAYDLWDTPFGAQFRQDSGATLLRESIIEKDTINLARCSPRLTIAANVSARLERYNGIPSLPVYHPPYMAERFYCTSPEAYVFVPSRLEETKRQELAIRAMKYVTTGLIAVICGEGGQRQKLEQLTEELQLRDRVKFLGKVSEEEKLGLYAHCLCVFFGPFDEDYGYVTLEAMLAAKPVVTCLDSGGPLEFVVHEQTGLVVEPSPDAIAHAFDSLNANRQNAAAMGRHALAHYSDLRISWESILCKLTDADAASSVRNL
jgi:glycosyltransferase involved in cell wall biosynthesis